MYSEKVMDHFQNPRNVGEIENASGVGTVGNAKCGDIMRIFLDIDDETKVIKDCKFKTFGCRCNKQHGNRACKRKDHRGGFKGDKQGGYGSTGRTSACKSTLFSSRRGSHSCGFMGLCREA